MQIQILSIQVAPATTKAGKPYEVLDIAFKNNTFQGKVEGKKLMPFGANAGAFNTLKNASSGATYEITVVKNDAGYNDWTGAVLSDGTVPAVPAANQSSKTFAPSGNNTTSNSRGFPTPEERAATQVHIIRQSTIKSAVDLLGFGAKSALKVSDVLDVAKQLENYVLDLGSPAADNSGFDNMDSDVPL